MSTSSLSPAESNPAEFRPVPPRQPWRWTGWLLATAAIIAWAAWDSPREIARWYLAAAEEKSLDDDLPAALALADQAVAWDPQNVEILLQRAQWRLTTGQYEQAVADCDRAIELAPEIIEPYTLRSEARLQLGQGEQAIADWDRVLALAPQKQFTVSVALNGRAYTRARANREIVQGLVDVETAIRRGGANAMYLDTRGYLFYLHGQPEESLADLRKAIAQTQRDAVESFAAAKIKYVDPRRLNALQKYHDHNLAVMYQHRGLAYETLGEKENAAADFRQAKKLGYNPKAGVW